MVVSEAKLKNLIDSTQEPIFCDAMNLWEIQQSLNVLHAVMVVNNHQRLDDFDMINVQLVFSGIETILAQACKQLGDLCDKGMADFQDAINVHECC